MSIQNRLSNSDYKNINVFFKKPWFHSTHNREQTDLKPSSGSNSQILQLQADKPI